MNKIITTLMLAFSFLLGHIGQAQNSDNFTQDEVNQLLAIRAELFGGSRLQAALEGSSINGSLPPIFAYNLADRALLVWELDESMTGAFADAIGLPVWMQLAKVKPITENLVQNRFVSRFERFLMRMGISNSSPEKKYYIVVDLANTERYVTGTKVEWKTFVTVGDDPTPRLVRFDSQSSTPGTDFIELFTPPFGLVQLNRDNDVVSGLVTNGQYSLDLSIPLRKSRYRNRLLTRRFIRFSEEFLTASERVYTPMGASARYYYDGSSVSTSMIAVDTKSAVVNNSFPWAQYTTKLSAVVVPEKSQEYLVQPITLPVTSDDESQLFLALTGQVLSQEVPPEQVFAQLGAAAESPSYPALFYGLLDVYQALNIFTGVELPKLTFSLKREPMAVFINFEIPARKARAFAEEYLPEGFRLAKMKFYPEQRRSVYAVTLNVYDAVGQNVNGFRAEWSTYVINPNEKNPQPRFSIIEAQTSQFGLDPLGSLEAIRDGRYDPNDLFSLIEGPAELFEFSLTPEDGMNIRIIDIAEEIDVNIQVAYPEEEEILHTRPMKKWMEANDYVYWGEAADILKYDSNVMFADLIVFDVTSEDLVMDNVFSEYVNPKPLPIILWNGVQDISLEPWGNLQDLVE